MNSPGPILQRREREEQLILVNLTSKIKDLLFVTKLITVFETFEDEDEAVNSF